MKTLYDHSKHLTKKISSSKHMAS